MKTFLRWFIIVIVVLIVLTMLRDFFIKSAIELASPHLIGAQIEMGDFSLGLLTHRIHIKDFRMYNPPGFPNEVFLDAPEVTVQVDTDQLLKGRTHCYLVVFNLKTMVIVKNKEGKLNVDSIKIIQEQQAANKGKPLHLPVFTIDLMDLNVGRVVMEDHTHAPPVKVTAYDVNIKNQKIRNIHGLPKLMASIIVEAMKPTAIRSAGMFAAEAVLGVGFLPALAIGVAIAQDDVNADLDHSYSSVYRTTLKLIHDLQGTVKNESSHTGIIMAKVYGCDITINIEDRGWDKTHIKIKARQYMLAKLEVATGLLYQIEERLK